MSARSSSPHVRAKMQKTYEDRTGHSGHWSTSIDVREKRRAAMLEKVADPSWTPTCGVKWDNERHEHYQRVWAEKRAERERKLGIHGTWRAYQRRCVCLTRMTIRHHMAKIENGHLERGHFKAHVDHVFSVKQGWLQDVDPEVICHWSNLRMIPYTENVRKQTRCDKTIEQLYEDYKMDPGHEER